MAYRVVPPDGRRIAGRRAKDAGRSGANHRAGPRTGRSSRLSRWRPAALPRPRCSTAFRNGETHCRAVGAAAIAFILLARAQPSPRVIRWALSSQRQSASALSSKRSSSLAALVRRRRGQAGFGYALVGAVLSVSLRSVTVFLGTQHDLEVALRVLPVCPGGAASGSNPAAHSSNPPRCGLCIRYAAFYELFFSNNLDLGSDGNSDVEDLKRLCGAARLQLPYSGHLHRGNPPSNYKLNAIGTTLLVLACYSFLSAKSFCSRSTHYEPLSIAAGWARSTWPAFRRGIVRAIV